MDAHRFDAVARSFADRRLSRRTAMRAAGLTGLAAALAGAIGGRESAMAAPRAADPPDDKSITFMFVQSFRSGTLTLKNGGDGTYALTLNQGVGQTIYFSDRPERVVGTTPTKTFLDAFPFGPDNPPNAALVLEAGADDTDVLVLELTAPSYDEATHTASYEAKVLADYDKLGITFQEAPKGAAPAHAEFGAASLFIDDCPDMTVCAIVGNFADPRVTVIGPLPGGSAGQCWHWSDLSCEPCSNSEDYYNSLCNNAYADCQGKCLAGTS